MSEETARALEEARTKENEQRAIVDRLEQELLDSIADGVPASLDKYGRSVADAQPDVTRELGADGVKQLRADLGFSAEALAHDIRTARDHIKWPSAKYGLSDTRKIRSAVYEFLYGARSRAIDGVFRARGYKFEEHMGFTPHALSDEQGKQAIEPLAQALRELAAAEAAVEEAKKADDRDAVSDLWGDAPA